MGGALFPAEQRFKAPPSPFSGRKSRDSPVVGPGASASEAVAAALLQRVSGGANGGEATLREGSDGSDGGWEEVLSHPLAPKDLLHERSGGPRWASLV